MFPTNRKQSMIVFDFMGYCRKLPIKRDELKTHADLPNHLWITFTFLSKNHSRINIVFDLCLDASIKEEERLRQSKDIAIEFTFPVIIRSVTLTEVDLERCLRLICVSRFNILACFRDVFIGLMLKYASLLLVITSSLSSIFS